MSRLSYCVSVALVLVALLAFAGGRLLAPRPQPPGCPHVASCPHCRGGDACLAGIGLENNPFPPCNDANDLSHPFNRWAEGWKAAERNRTTQSEE
jgi:hypothetical protein